MYFSLLTKEFDSKIGSQKNNENSTFPVILSIVLCLNEI